MSANDILPRGGTFQTNVGSNTTPTITLLAIPHVSWILTDIQLTLWGNSAADGEAVTVNGTQYPLFVTAAGNGEWSGQEQFPPNTAVTISTTGSGSVNRFCILQVKAYPA